MHVELPWWEDEWCASSYALVKRWLRLAMLRNVLSAEFLLGCFCAAGFWCMVGRGRWAIKEVQITN